MTASLRRMRILYPGYVVYFLSLPYILKGYFARPDVLLGPKQYASRQLILQPHCDTHNDLAKKVQG